MGVGAIEFIGGFGEKRIYQKSRAARRFVADPIAETVNRTAMNILRIIDEIEQGVEESKGVQGKRFAEEEAFYTKIQQLRSALPQAMKDAEDAGAARYLGNNASVSLQRVAHDASALSQA